MKVLRYFCPLLICVLHLIVESSGEAQTDEHKNSHVKQKAKGLHSSGDSRTNSTVEKQVKLEKLVNERKDTHLVLRRHGSPSNSLQFKRQKFTTDNKILVKGESLTVVSNKTSTRTRNMQRLKDNISTRKNSVQKSHLGRSNGKTKLIASQSKKATTAKKKKLFKKYALFQSLSSLQAPTENEQPIMAGGEESNAGYAFQAEGDQTGDAAVQGQSPDDQQQLLVSDDNSLSQYAASQDSAGYQTDNSQPSEATFAENSNENAAQSEEGQPSSLEQVIQLQQAGYTQQPQEQEQDQEAPSPSSQAGVLTGQEQTQQVVDNGQMQFQSEQAGQEQEQPVQEQGQQEQPLDEQTGLQPAVFQQEQTQQLDQQQSQGVDQPQEDQTQQYQPQQQDEGQAQQEQEEQQQQLVEEPQDTQEAPSEVQGLSASSNSYGGLFSTEGQPPATEQQSQATLSYSNEQSNEGGDKSTGPGVQFASSIEEALKEPGVSSQEGNSEGGDAQEPLDANEGASIVNMRPGSDSKAAENNGFMGTGSITAPTTYQTSVVDDNGNPIQTGPNQEVNGYASSLDQQGNADANGFEGNQPVQSPSLVESQDEQNFAEQQSQHQGSGPKASPMENNVFKIISVPNKNAPSSVKGCKGCPPHARCVNKVCIINDDQPLAHILSALSGPEPEEDSDASECKECHYNAKCLNKECVCKAGYTGDGIDCRPDTCLPGCKEHGKCIKGFCLCDHHHYFNGYECSPYKITHKNCPIQCTTSCHAKCPINCCKHHPVIKTHYNDGNFQQMGETGAVSAPLPKDKNGPHHTDVVLKPFIKLGQPIANFAPEFQSRPTSADESDLEAIKNPATGLTITGTEAKPLLGEDDCQEKCNYQCLDSCPVKCCLKNCPLNCLEDCNQSCPKPCCFLNKIQFPMMDPTTQENFMKAMAEKFCPRACKTKCDSKCPPICCEGISTSTPPQGADLGHRKMENKKKTDFIKKAKSWFGMMNFLNMMNGIYANMNGLQQMKFPFKLSGTNTKTFNPTKSKSFDAKSPMHIKQLGTAEDSNGENASCPSSCNATCVHLCPQRCCHDRVKAIETAALGGLPYCQPSCRWFCSNSCPKSCCVKDKRPGLVGPNTSEKVPKIESSEVSSSAVSNCSSSCPAYCYPHCLVDCCERGVVESDPKKAHLKAKQSYNNFFAKQPEPSNPNCPAHCQSNCTSLCPLRCCERSISLPTQSRFPAPSNGHICPGGCVSECFPACTMTCCRAAVHKHDPTQKPTRRQYQPVKKPPFSPSQQSSVCSPGCLRLCYPHCDENCCKAAGLSSSLFKSGDVGSSSFTSKEQCPSECRPFNCLYYCHHGCCLQGNQHPFFDIGRRPTRTTILQTKKKYITTVKNIKATVRNTVLASDKSTFGGRMGNKRAVIRQRPRH